MIYHVTMVMLVETHKLNAYHSTTLMPCLVLLLHFLLSIAQPKMMEEDISKAHIALM